jgi:two-component system, NtrC family, sensor kinase
MVPLDLSALARDVAYELRATQPDRRVEIVIADGLTALGDATLIRAALVNLLSNAWKFTGKTDAPRIELGRHDDGRRLVTFFVVDNGAGFAMDSAANLFTPFQRMHRQDEFPGTGVGLATVQRIVVRHGGRIWAQSEPNRGATFYFSLPPVDTESRPHGQDHQ